MRIAPGPLVALACSLISLSLAPRAGAQPPQSPQSPAQGGEPAPPWQTPASDPAPPWQAPSTSTPPPAPTAPAHAQAPAAPGALGTNPSALPTAPVPAPPAAAAPRPFVELTTLKLLLAKGTITQAEYDAAVAELADSMGERSKDSPTLSLGKWKTTLYGFVQGDFMIHSTQSFNDYAANGQVARPDTYAGQHARVQGSIRDSRFGFRIQAPALGEIRSSAVLEMDFLGPTGSIPATISESSFFLNPVLRVRHAYFKVETPVVDVTFGQTWHVFGMQPSYIPAVVQWAGVVGELFSRTPQLRLSHTFKSEQVNFDIAVAGMRPPERDSGAPEGEAGLKLSFNKWAAWHTGYLTSTTLMPASISVSGDVRYFSVPEFAEKPVKANTTYGWGVAVDAYLPIVPGTKESKDNSLSAIGEFVTGRSINDLYTGLTGGVANAALPNPAKVTPAPAYPAAADTGLLAYDAAGNLLKPRWTTFLVGAEYYLPFVGGRVALFGSVARSHLQDAASYPTPAKVRDTEWMFDGGFFVDPLEAVRVGIDYAHLDDLYADGIKAKNEAGQISGFFFF